MDMDLDLLADLLGAYEEFDHHRPPDLPEGPGVLSADGAPVPEGQLRPADRVVQERIDEADLDETQAEEANGEEADAQEADAGENSSEKSRQEVRERELEVVYRHVGLLVEGGFLASQEDFYEELPIGELPALGKPGSHEAHVLTMKGHQLLDRLRDRNEEDGSIGFTAS